MNGGYIAAVTMFFTILLILAQRIEARRKRLARYFIPFMMLLLMLHPNEALRPQNLVAYALALFISFVFWVLIGRYNPVGSSDAIKVYGLDD